MSVLGKIYRVIGFVSEWSGKVISILIIVLIISITYDVVARYIFNAPTSWSFSLSYMLGGSFAVIGLAYVYYHDGNIRIDLIYSKFTPKGRLAVDIIFTLIFTLPLLFMLTLQYGEDALYSYSVNEKALESVWYPILWPFKTILVIGFGLVSLQAVATLMKDIVKLIKGVREPW